jgi:hypothetical protein
MSDPQLPTNLFPERSKVEEDLKTAEFLHGNTVFGDWMISLMQASRSYLLLQSANEANIGSINHFSNLLSEQKLQNARLREALESGQEIVFEGSRHMAIPVSTIEESLSTTPTNAMDCVREIVATIERNHKWHQVCDDYDGYADSELCEENMRAIAKAKEVFGV